MTLTLLNPPIATPSAVKTLTKFLDPLPIPPLKRPPLVGDPVPHMDVRMRDAWVRLHSQLPTTRVWAYDGVFPGPTIEVHRGQRIHVNWVNEIAGPLPLVAVEVPITNLTQGPGRDGGTPRADVAALPPWTVVHLHGARTGGGNDGWTENAVLRSDAQLAEYPNDQPAATMWYHDHAMAITSLNVMSGLAGMYLIRDEEEEALHLPRGRHEVPLIFCDRNLDTDGDGNLTGQLLYKVGFLTAAVTDQKVGIPFSGPFNLVNGRIWPFLDVEAKWYRFRLLNASNSRFYTIELHDENGSVIPAALTQIGTEAGLIGAPTALDRLTLAPAERADVLVNFAALRGTHVTMVNATVPAQTDPEMMQFRVSAQATSDHFQLPSTLSHSFVRLTHDNLPAHEHRWLVLAPPNLNASGLPDPPVSGHPEIWEMEEVDATTVTVPSDGVVQVQAADGAIRTLRRRARTFNDRPTFFVEHNGWEQWTVVNLSGITHPLHIHLIRFQATVKEVYNFAGFNLDIGGTTTPVTFQSASAIDPSEAGWKDVIRVGPGELIKVAGEFGGGSGRFMYHCHILEHEDAGMMGAFVVMPREVMAIDPHITGDGHSH